MLTAQAIPLEQFNQVILQNQDKAYTLAYHLTGSEALAEQLVSKAVVQAYRHIHSHSECIRCALLKQIIQLSQKFHANKIPVTDDITTRIIRLPRQERAALVLVDILGFDYNDSADILQASPRQVSHWLASARAALMQAAIRSS